MFGFLGGLHTSVVKPRAAVPPPPLVLDAVTVIDVEHGTRLLNQRIVIVGSRIQSMGSAATVRIPAGAHVVAARGKYVIPGLWDVHVHPAAVSPQSTTHYFYPLLLVNGVTGIRDAGGTAVKLDTLRQWRADILAGTRVGPPRMILSGPFIDEGPKRNVALGDTLGARRLVDSIAAAGADMIKVRVVSRALYVAIAAEARRLRIPFGGHADDVAAIEAADHGARLVDHMNQFLDSSASGLHSVCWGAQADPARCQMIAAHFRHRGTWLVPTLVACLRMPVAAGYGARSSLGKDGDAINGTVLGTAIRDSILSVSMHGTVRSINREGNWLRHMPLPWSAPSQVGGMRVLRQAGMPLLAGTDLGPPGFSVPAELAIFVAEGLTPLEALQTATLNPAKMWHATDSLGTVASGKLADLVLLDADPLVDITNVTTVRAVIANGRYFDRPALDSVFTAAVNFK